MADDPFAGMFSGELDDDWYAHHYNHLDPRLGQTLHASMALMREKHPVARSEELGGFFVVSTYEDVLNVAQDWETFSSAQGVTIPGFADSTPAIPEMVDPPLHTTYKRIINPWFRPATVREHEDAVRVVVNELIDDMIDDVDSTGSTDFIERFARPLPGIVFFRMYLHAPEDELAAVNALATTASIPSLEMLPAREKMLEWITKFVADRRASGPVGDVVDAIMDADVDGRPITELEAIGMIQLLLFGGLDTTAGALGMSMVRFTQDPGIPAFMREHPELLDNAVEELLRLDGPFIAIARTVTQDTEVRGCPMKTGDKVLLSWASANYDEAEFSCPADFDAERDSNRHVAFGAGPHRCAGSNLARMNLRIAFSELVRRLPDVRLAVPIEDIAYHSVFSRVPKAVPLTFTIGPRETR